MIFKYPEIYKTGIAVAGVSDLRFYDTIYQERYQGLPQDNEEGYKNGSPIHFAHQLEGNLLIIHGTADDNVHYQSFEMLVFARFIGGMAFASLEDFAAIAAEAGWRVEKVWKDAAPLFTVQLLGRG